MSIENTLERIAKALETIAANGGTQIVGSSEPIKVETPKKETVKKEAKKAAAEPDPIADEKPAKAASEFTIEHVRDALKAYREIEGQDAMLDILKQQGGGAKNLAELKEEHFAAVINATK